MIRLYMDEHIPAAIAEGLRARGVDVLAAQEDGRGESPDEELLDRATELGRVLFSFDEDFLRIGSRRQSEGIVFAGIVYAHAPRVTIGQCVRDLELICLTGEAADLENRVDRLPL